MSDRLFADCCYGTDWQHGPNDTCPFGHLVNPSDETVLAVAGILEARGNLRQAFVAGVEAAMEEGKKSKAEPAPRPVPLAEPEDGCWYGIELCSMPYCDCDALSRQAGK